MPTVPLIRGQRFPPLEVCVRRPWCTWRHLRGPASENLHNTRHRPNSRYRAAMYYVSVSALETFSPISLATSAACVAIMEWAAPGTVTGEALGMAPHRISALLVM